MRSPRLIEERGSASLELVIWGPALLLLLTLVIFAGRVAQARLTVEAAAGEAARAATVVGNRAEAGSRATAAAEDALSSAGLQCASVSVAVDTTQWERPAGQLARATATITCNVDLDGLIGVGIPGSKTVQASASSALDTFRSRS